MILELNVHEFEEFIENYLESLNLNYCIANLIECNSGFHIRFYKLFTRKYQTLILEFNHKDFNYDQRKRIFTFNSDVLEKKIKSLIFYHEMKGE